MNIALWIVQGLLALLFISVGSVKTFQFEKAKATLPWVKDSLKGLVTFIGVSELLGGIGLIVPLATGIMPSLTPIAAIGLAVIMFLGGAFHAKLKEYKGVVMNIILLALTVFVALGRL